VKTRFGISKQKLVSDYWARLS